MPEKEYLKMTINVLARMTAADEIRRQKRLGLDVINEKVIEGLIEQRQHLENQQTQTLKILVLLVFLSFVAWQGGNIKIPGTGASIAEVPGFLEISLVLSALTLMWLPYLFLSIQIYEGVIQSIVKQLSAQNLIDEDIVVASRMPVQLFLKYARESVIIGRKNGFTISPHGKAYNTILVGLLLLAFSLFFVFLFVSVLVIAHLGLDDEFLGWSVYLLCWFVICVGVIAISANFVNSRYEMDFNHLEIIEPPADQSGVAG
ncbi:MAG: hypothetical protein Q8P46_01120 [Hyphomicrobiales bacterium]|nr:hypothetical protein [Hyphomicrobiales bacterium]